MPLILAATPIGDPRDASARLIGELAGADVIAAEDTRRTRRLCAALDVTPRGRLLSYHEHNESAVTADLIARLAAGERILLVTDAGMPSVSDPGYRLVAAAVAADLPVTCAPGPSAVLVALALSGLPVDRFAFDGFLPRKPGERVRPVLGLRGRRARPLARHRPAVDLAAERRTMVFFEAPHRTEATLRAMAEAFGADRPAAVCRELTKTYEEVRRGSLTDLVDWAANGVLGEVTIVVAGATAQVTDLATAVVQVRELMNDGLRLKDACAEVAALTGQSKKALYDAVLASR